MLGITKIKLKNLWHFVQSEQYLSFANKPISISRVQSYIENPNANEDDVVLYMAFINNYLVGYRTILADVFYYEDTKQKFGWLSGNWVHPEHRRKNISTTLFNEVIKDWDNKLMYSNYAEESKALYDKTNSFAELKSLNGIRYYRRFSLATILPSKNKVFQFIKPLLIANDWFLNLFFDLRFAKSKEITNFNIQKINGWNEVMQTFISPFKDSELFKQNTKTYQWIANYPWIKTDEKSKKLSKKYYFSSYAKIFKNDFYLIKNKANEIVAILNISIRNKQLKIPYFYGLDNAIIPATNLIVNLCYTYNINHLTIYDTKINKALKTKSFLHKKTFKQKYFITKTLLKKYPKITDFKIQTGDGDFVFT